MVYIMQYVNKSSLSYTLERQQSNFASRSTRILKKAYEQLFVLECINRVRLTCDKGLHCLPCMKQS